MFRRLITMSLFPTALPFTALRKFVSQRCIIGNLYTVKIDFYHSRNFHLSSVSRKVIPFRLSDIGEGIRDVVIKEWYVNVGDSIKQFDPICEVQSDKATVTITSRYDGVVRTLHYQPQDVCAVGQPLIDIESISEDTKVDLPINQQKRDVLETHYSPDNSTVPIKVLTTPSVRRIAMENKVKLSDVVGTGKDGRIMKDDILSFLNRGHKQVEQTEAQSFSPSFEFSRRSSEDVIVPLTSIQRSMKAAMIHSNSIPHFILADELDLNKLVQLRDEFNQDLAARQGMKLTFMPFFIKAASLALFRYPILNAYTDENCDNVIHKASHNIGVAMDTPDGLLVPNVKSVDRLTVLEIAQELKRLQDLGLRGKLGTTDLSGGTMTLSNIGSICGTYTAPRILAPQILIGGLGRIQRLPRFDEFGSVRVGHCLNVSWAADHRVTDGATVAKFSMLWRNYLENPSSLILELR